MRVGPVLTWSAFLSLWNDINEVALEGILILEHREVCFYLGHTDSQGGPACNRRVTARISAGTAAVRASTSPMCPRPQGIVGLGMRPGQVIHLRPRTITLLDTTGVTGGTTLSEPAFPPLNLYLHVIQQYPKALKIHKINTENVSFKNRIFLTSKTNLYTSAVAN